MQKNHTKSIYTKDKDVPTSEELMQDAEVQAIIKPYVRQGEKVLWIGKPHKRLYEERQKTEKVTYFVRFIIRFILRVIYILIMLVLLVYAISSEDPIGNLLIILFWGGFLGSLLFLRGEKEWEKIDTLYVITNTHVMVFNNDKEFMGVRSIHNLWAASTKEEGININVLKTKNVNGISYSKIKLSILYRGDENDLIENYILLHYVRTEGLKEAAQTTKWQKINE